MDYVGGGATPWPWVGPGSPPPEVDRPQARPPALMPTLDGHSPRLPPPHGPPVCGPARLPPPRSPHAPERACTGWPRRAGGLGMGAGGVAIAGPVVFG